MWQDTGHRIIVTIAFALFTGVVVTSLGFLVGGQPDFVLGAVVGVELAVAPLVYVLCGHPDLW